MVVMTKCVCCRVSLCLLSCAWLLLSGCLHARTIVPQPRGARPFVSFYKDGTRRAEGAYLRGKKHGFFTKWFRYGRKQFEGRYVHGKPHGTHRFWRAHGAIKRKMIYSYRKGVPHLRRQDFYGTLPHRELFYVNNRLVKRIRWSGRHKLRETEYRGQGRELRRVWYPQSGPRSVCSFRRHRRHGLCRRWYPSGKPKREITYANRARHGLSRQWDAAGRLLYRSRYEKGQPHGEEIYFYSNGEPYKRNRYWRGRRCGEALQFRKTGTLWRKRAYPPCPAAWQP